MVPKINTNICTPTKSIDSLDIKNNYVPDMKKFAFKCKNLNDMLCNWLTIVVFVAMRIC